MNIVREIFYKIRAHFEILKKGWGDLPLFPSSGETSPRTPPHLVLLVEKTKFNFKTLIWKYVFKLRMVIYIFRESLGSVNENPDRK